MPTRYIQTAEEKYTAQSDLRAYKTGPLVCQSREVSLHTPDVAKWFPLGDVNGTGIGE